MVGRGGANRPVFGAAWVCSSGGRLGWFPLRGGSVFWETIVTEWPLGVPGRRGMRTISPVPDRSNRAHTCVAGPNATIRVALSEMCSVHQCVVDRDGGSSQLPHANMSHITSLHSVHFVPPRLSTSVPPSSTGSPLLNFRLSRKNVPRATYLHQLSRDELAECSALRCRGHLTLFPAFGWTSRLFLCRRLVTKRSQHRVGCASVESTAMDVETTETIHLGKRARALLPGAHTSSPAHQHSRGETHTGEHTCTRPTHKLSSPVSNFAKPPTPPPHRSIYPSLQRRKTYRRLVCLTTLTAQNTTHARAHSWRKKKKTVSFVRSPLIVRPSLV
mmetsp:Transcript_24768/g.71474  ORF Transcript_24768/g.71474 Transcript_24768/m.71474 type:complete len:330 (-) Transcript_24768:3986-4975(-)